MVEYLTREVFREARAAYSENLKHFGFISDARNGAFNAICDRGILPWDARFKKIYEAACRFRRPSADDIFQRLIQDLEDRFENCNTSLEESWEDTL